MITFRAVPAFLAMAVSPLIASPLSAQQRGPQGARDTLQTVVVTATRVPMSTNAPTATTTVLSGDALRAQGIVKVSDALRQVPGVQMVQSGPQGSLTSLFLRGGNSNYVRVLVDGVAVNDAGGAFDFAALSTDNIERIEVVRGPASVLYGSDAVTGVIQIITRDGRGGRGYSLEAGRGANGAQRGSFGVHGGDATASYSLLGARQATDGVLPYNNRNVTDVLSAATRLSNGVSEARLSARWSGSLYQYPTEFDGTVADRNSEQVDHRFVVSADLSHRVSRDLSLHLLLGSNEYLPRSNDGPDSAADTLGFFGYYSRAVRTRRTVETRFDYRFTERNTLTIGGEVARDRERSSSLSLSQYGNSPDAFEAARHNSALYVQALGDAVGRLSYSLGGRLDQNSAFGTFRTARASIGWLLGTTTRVRVSMGNAFKAPSFSENFATGFVTGNKALRPERSRSTELGFESYLHEGTVAVRGALFTQQFTDVIQYTGTAPTPGAPNYYNVAAAKSDGAELSAEWKVTPMSSITAAQTWVNTRTTKSGFDKSTGASYVVGEQLIRRPAQSSTLTAEQRWADGSRFQVTAMRVGARADRDFAAFPSTAVTLPAYTRVDASMVLPFQGADAGGPQLVLSATNITNVKYEEVLHFASPGRLWYLGLRIGR